ncbi:MAG: tetratricopeptide repeat protein [Anaerolineales bacterium]|nr:tetratricopeptide repeat protein [Anaerolineales bacterium]
MERLGAREEWMEFLVRGRALAAAHQDLAAEVECVLQVAFLHQLRGNLAEASELLEGALAKLATQEFPRLRSAVLNRAAFVAYLQGRYADASALASTAQHAAPRDAVVEIAQNEFIWGVLAQTHHEWLESKVHFLEALRLSEAHPFHNPRMIAWGLLNLGTAHRRLEEQAQALDCYVRAVELLEQIGDRVHAAVARMNIGNLHLLAERPQVALEWYQTAEPVFRQVRDEVRLALIYINMGIAWRDAGDYARGGDPAGGD